MYKPESQYIPQTNILFLRWIYKILVHIALAEAHKFLCQYIFNKGCELKFHYPLHCFKQTYDERIVLIIKNDLFCIIFVGFSSEKNIKLFSYNELRSATDNFHRDNKIGRGGFGTVYKVLCILFILLI